MLLLIHKLVLIEGIYRVHNPVAIAPRKLLSRRDIVTCRKGELILCGISTHIGREVVDILDLFNILHQRLPINSEIGIVGLSSNDLLHRDHLGVLWCCASYTLILSLLK